MDITVDSGALEEYDYYEAVRNWIYKDIFIIKMIENVSHNLDV